jgi:hypothetical protein
MTGTTSERGESATSSTVKAAGEEERKEVEEEVSTPNAIAEFVRGVTQPAAGRSGRNPRTRQPNAEEEVSTPNAVAESIRDGNQKK